jgi:hypothetical protein
MRPLVELHGANNVNNAGLAVLGFPGILAECPREVEAIRKELESDKKDINNVH